MGWVRRHRVLVAFGAGVLVTLAVLGAALYALLADQRRTGRLLAAALSRVLARDLVIERVTALAPSRVVLRGVRVERARGWPADARVDEVEATGPLLAAARGEAAPVRLVLSGVSVTLPQRPAEAWSVAALRDSLIEALRIPLHLDVAVQGGRARRGDLGASFELHLQKGDRAARAEVTLRGEGAEGPPVTLTADARLAGEAARVRVRGRGPAEALRPWLPAAATPPAGGRALALDADVSLGPGDALEARSRLELDGLLGASGEARVRDGVVRLRVPEVAADLGLLRELAGWPGAAGGQLRLREVTLAWRPDTEPAPTADARVEVTDLSASGLAAGRPVAAGRVEGWVRVRPAAAGARVEGEVRAEGVASGDLRVDAVDAGYRVELGPGWRPVRAAVERLEARLAGARLVADAVYEPGDDRLDATLSGRELDAAELLRRVAPDQLRPGGGLRVGSLRIALHGVALRGLDRGSVEVELRDVQLARGELRAVLERLTGRARLAAGRAGAHLEGTGLHLAGAGVEARLPVLDARATVRGLPGAPSVEDAFLEARDAGGRPVLRAEVRPGARAGWSGVQVEAPELERLQELLGAGRIRLRGSARADLEVRGLAEAEGTVRLQVGEAEVLEGRLALRDLTVELPVRRSGLLEGPPPWGSIEIGEAIAYRVVVRDLSTPARLWRDRLSLNDLRYTLYSGEGGGWGEVEWEAGGLHVRGQLTGEGVRIEEFIAAYGIRGGTMTGLLRYELDYRYRSGQLALRGRFEVPQGGTVNIELLNRVLAWAEADPTGLLRRAVENLRVFGYRTAAAEVTSVAGDVRVNVALEGRRILGIFPGRVPAIRISNLPLSFLARQFPGH